MMNEFLQSSLLCHCYIDIVMSCDFVPRSYYFIMRLHKLYIVKLHHGITGCIVTASLVYACIMT